MRAGLGWARRVQSAGLSHRLTAERGLTIVEVMVAAMVLVIGAFAIFKIVDAATRTSYRAEQSQVISNLLQRELERVKARDSSQIALATGPGACAVAPPPELTGAEGGPARWQAGGAFDGSGGFDGRPWVVADEGVADPIKPCEAVTVAEGEGGDSSDVAVNVYRMVTWFDPDKASCVPPSEAESPDQACGMRRITIGAKPIETGPGGERAYKEIQSDVMESPGETE